MLLVLLLVPCRVTAGGASGRTGQRSVSSPKQSEYLHGESMAFSLEAEQALVNFDVQPHMFSWQECDGVQVSRPTSAGVTRIVPACIWHAHPAS